MFSYPNAIPLAEVQNVITIVRTNQTVERKTELAHDAWVVQGYAQHMLLGDPAVISLQSEFDGVATLEKIVAAHEAEAAGGPAQQIQVPWKLLASWAAKILLTALTS